MLSFVDPATRPEFTVAAVDCRDDHRGWSTEQPREDVRLVLVRHGGFRHRVRVAHALDRLEAGEPSLAVLAADLRFADQAHLCRTVREHLGHTPTALRRLLA